MDDYFKNCIKKYQSSWRKVIGIAIEYGIPVPTFSSAISYYDSYRAERLPQNLLQAQRDYFGAHTYERTDQPRGKFFHLDWLHPERPEEAL
jgi:6-phosphogluconate dehydrogenase